ncbi:flagellar type III secretion system pore protein FliP [Undibacterium sp. Ji49W]|uniref:flagellar type III secretion system pore protein FliP n=1 Tax=Undibacterium sp. Ji49W TaxID=3413040 RepID=UPI003BF57EF4
MKTHPSEHWALTRYLLKAIFLFFLSVSAHAEIADQGVGLTPGPSTQPSASNRGIGNEEKLHLEQEDVPQAPEKSLPQHAALRPKVVAQDDGSLVSKLKPDIISSNETSQALRVILGLTILAVIPAILVSMTAFLRIIIVLSMLRHAIGMQETPPNSALIGLAIFLTLFTMSSTLQTLNEDAFQPFMSGKINAEIAFSKASTPIREFMIKQTREKDLALMIELSKAKLPESVEEVGSLQLIPAFMLSELRSAFQIGFVIFLPFLLIDLIVSSILMALGMMMMPPISIALPVKILMFVLIDGWSLVLKALVGSFH